MLSIHPAKINDIAQLAQLFDAYRQFYEQVPDIALATTFIAERLNKQDSQIFVAVNQDQKLIGFCQIYPSFCSVAVAKIGVLYDLFVDSTARKTGAGRALMLAAQEYAANNDMARLDLSTAKTNINAQKLYESLGWVRDDVFYTYNLDMQRLNM
jgi:ribosomal protein S18 acetylase RimI-like enzyme